MARLFGFEFKRTVEPDQIAPSFAPIVTDDGAVTVAAGGAYGTYVDLDGTVRTEAELVTKYREMSLQPEVDAAVDEIVNETMSIDEDVIVSIVLDKLDITDKIKKAIRDEFANVLNILNFQNRAYEIVRRWYIDGRLYYHVVIDEKDTKAGIKELRYVDPRKIRKIRVLSYMHKAIKALNQLRTLEDALVIYRLARAPERRIWYIDVGNLPKMKAEQYVRDIMVKHKNRLIYDGATGEVRDDRKFMTMLEDYWLPRREGGRGTEVTTLPGGQTLGEMDDVLYFQKKLYQTLNVPINRLNSDALFSLGRATEVSRDELKFARFISRLRGRFAQLFTSVLEKQLVLKGVMSIEDWYNISPDIKYDFSKDNYFSELKDAEILENRINLMQLMTDAGFVGKYYSQEWARKNVLHQDDDMIEKMNEQIDEEATDPRWALNLVPPEGGEEPPGANAEVQPGAGDDDVAETPATDQKNKKIRDAKVAVELLGKKKGRSMQDESKYRSALQILAKNK